MTVDLEAKRQKLEELDVIESEISKRIKRNPALWQSPAGHNILGGKKRRLKDTLLQQHEIRAFIEQYRRQCEALNGTLDPVPREEDQDLSLFDQKYAEIRDFHTKYPERPIDNLSSTYAMYSSASGAQEEATDSKGKRRKLRRSILSAFAADLRLEQIFTAEEAFGAHLDLENFYKSWLGLPGNDLEISFAEYLDIFNKLPYPTTLTLKLDRGSSKYVDYITGLARYLVEFYIKIQPLVKPQASIAKIGQDFENRHAQADDGEFAQNSEENRYALHGDGTVTCLACDKKFAKFSVYKGHLNSKKHLKNWGDAAKPKISPIVKEDVDRLLKAEFEVREVSQLLARQISATRTNVERKKLLTDRERAMELESQRLAEEEEMFESSSGDENDAEDDDDDADATSYNNPLKLPLGPDGKPIPYWLFKLSGLGLEFSCEVCGNHVYQGRKNYVAHFGDSKHLNGLKCLGIDTSLASVFKGISRIEDVLKLKEKYRAETKNQANLMESVEEVEDEEGNVMSRRDYEDLKKQGLI